MKISKLIDGEKLHRDMESRYQNLNNLIMKDYNGDPERLFHQWWELKYWKEALFDRNEYTIERNEDNDKTI